MVDPAFFISLKEVLPHPRKVEEINRLERTWLPEGPDRRGATGRHDLDESSGSCPRQSGHAPTSIVDHNPPERSLCGTPPDAEGRGDEPERTVRKPPRHKLAAIAAVTAIALPVIIVPVLLRDDDPCSSSRIPPPPGGRKPWIGDKYPPPDIASQRPAIAPAQVRFMYRNESRKDLRLIVFNVSKYYEDRKNGHPERGAWEDWPFCRSDNFEVNDAFNKGTGWFSFWAYDGIFRSSWDATTCSTRRPRCS